MRRRVGVVGTSPTSTSNVTFPQLRRDDAPHLPDSSRKSTRRFKYVGIFFFCCLLENGWGNPVETPCLATLTAGVVRKKYYPYVIHELERLVQKLTPAFFDGKPILFSTFLNSVSFVCAHLILLLHLVLHLGEVMSHIMH